jgi:hypothetical protein
MQTIRATKLATRQVRFQAASGTRRFVSWALLGTNVETAALKAIVGSSTMRAPADWPCRQLGLGDAARLGFYSETRSQREFDERLALINAENPNF